ncbi:unnamed protein product [Allacma fusca]|uniref:Peptidase S1 domain-containing protein n=1 Tax=Allacma fusca TaxID=39272 RepID=A0A8J2P1R8_9HEXA|nr:unnamed protein product [Allacma fusca]
MSNTHTSEFQLLLLILIQLASSCVCTKPTGTRGGDSGGAVVCYDEKGPYAHGVVSWGPEDGDIYSGVKPQLDFIKCRNSTKTFKNQSSIVFINLQFSKTNH